MWGELEYVWKVLQCGMRGRGVVKLKWHRGHPEKYKPVEEWGGA